MKKILKTAASLFLAAALVTAELPAGFSVDANAEGTLTTKVTYAEDGTASVTLTPSEWGNTIYFTVDGTVPTEESLRYFGTFEVSEERNFRIAEFDKNGKKIKGIKKTVKPKVMGISFSVRQDYENAKAYVTVECTTPEAVLYYTTDGTKPTKESAVVTGEIEVSEKTRIRVRGFRDGYTASATFGKTVKIEKKPVEQVETAESSIGITKNDEENVNNTETEENKAAEEEKEDTSKSKKINGKVTYTQLSKSYVSFKKQNSNNTIRYTTDGSEVTKSSKKYKSRITFTEPGLIRAKEYNTKGELVGTLKMKVDVKCGAPEIICVDFTTDTRVLELTTKTEGATIYYTMDNTDPSPTNGYKYTAPVSMGHLTNIKAIAVKEGYDDSILSSGRAGIFEFKLKSFDFTNPTYKEVSDVINKYRKDNGLPALELNEKLTLAANIRAKELSVLMEHERPLGGSFASVAGDCEVGVGYISEVISSYYEDPVDLLNSMLLGVGNKDILLTDDADSIGIGCYYKGKTPYWAIIVADVV